MPKITPEVHSGKGRSGTPPSRSNSSDRLVQLETEIRDGQADYAVVGAALTEIQSARLYKPQYNTFEEYCEKRWGFERRHAYNFIAAKQVLETVHLNAQNKPSLTQAVQLARLDSTQQQEVANKFNFKNATVRDVKQVVDAKLGKEPVPEPKEPKDTTLEAALDALVTKIVMQPYGYHAAKFTTYAFQHSSEIQVVALAKKDVYRQIGEICLIKQ